MGYIGPTDLDVGPKAREVPATLIRNEFSQGDFECSQMAHGGLSDHDSFQQHSDSKYVVALVLFLQSIRRSDGPRYVKHVAALVPFLYHICRSTGPLFVNIRRSSESPFVKNTS